MYDSTLYWFWLSNVFLSYSSWFHRSAIGPRWVRIWRHDLHLAWSESGHKKFRRLALPRSPAVSTRNHSLSPTVFYFFNDTDCDVSIYTRRVRSRAKICFRIFDDNFWTVSPRDFLFGTTMRGTSAESTNDSRRGRKCAGNAQKRSYADSDHAECGGVFYSTPSIVFSTAPILNARIWTRVVIRFLHYGIPNRPQKVEYLERLRELFDVVKQSHRDKNYGSSPRISLSNSPRNPRN